MSPELLVGALAVVVAILLWLFKPDALRRLLLIQPKEEPLPHSLSGVEMERFRDDPVIGRAVREAEAAGATFAMSLEHQAARKQSEGFEFFRTPSGAKCRYVGGHPNRSEVFFLMVRRVPPNKALQLTWHSAFQSSLVAFWH